MSCRLVPNIPDIYYAQRLRLVAVGGSIAGRLQYMRCREGDCASDPAPKRAGPKVMAPSRKVSNYSVHSRLDVGVTIACFVSRATIAPPDISSCGSPENRMSKIE